MMVRAAALGAAMLLSACAAPTAPVMPAPLPGPLPGSTNTASTAVVMPPPPNLGVVPPPAAQADAFAVAFLDSIQARSFTGRREYCGYFLLVGGSIVATEPIPGTTASCTQPAPPPNAFASYHTHGPPGPLR